MIPKKKKTLLNVEARGVRVQFVVYDILPLLIENIFRQEFTIIFSSWFETISLFEKLHCISETTKKEVERFLQVFFPERLKKLELHSFVLGNEITDEDASKGKPKEAEKIQRTNEKRQTFRNGWNS